MKSFVEKALILVGRILQILHFLRVQIFVALLVAFLIPTGVCLHNGTFIGLADAIGSYSLTIITLSLFLLAWTLHITTRLVLIYGPERYGIPNITCPPTKLTLWRRFLHSPWFTLTVAAILPIPTLIDLWRNTCLPPTSHKAIAIAVGLLAAIVSLVIAATVHDWLEAKGGTTAEQVYPAIFIIHPGRNRIAAGRFHTDTATLRIASDRAMDGIFKNGDLRSGHQAAMLFVVIFFLIYVAFFFAGLSPHSYPHLPAALFFAYLLVIWLTWILAGLSFALDRFHIPVITTLLLASLVLSAFLPKDHEFDVSPNSQQYGALPLTPDAVVGAWEKAHPAVAADPNSPIVVITTEGGGIEAAAWANLVLSNLEKETQNRLHNSIVLVSSVSGGSTGAYYYLGQFGSSNSQPTFQDNDALNNSEASSLNAVGWGFAYPDFFRTIPIASWIVPPHSDRGYTLEQAWRNQFGTSDSMRQWINDTTLGVRPAVIFNATGAETGQPVLFGTTRLSRCLPWFQGINDLKLEQQFLLDFSGTDLPVSTAARMSAAFPYISPESRPDKLFLKDDHGTATPAPTTTSPCPIEDEAPQQAGDSVRLHVADGGLFDNSGVVSAVHWIYDLSYELSQDPQAVHHPIILIMITSPYQEKPAVKWSWEHQLIGPIETLLHVRTGSQHVRRNLEAQLLSNLSNKTVVSTNPGTTESKAAGQIASAQKSFPPVTILRFCNATDRRRQTLSWHLTKDQKEALNETWEKYYDPKSTEPYKQEVQALMYLLDPANQRDVPPSNTCPTVP
jgi:hypothetical protein